MDSTTGAVFQSAKWFRRRSKGGPVPQRPEITVTEKLDESGASLEITVAGAPARNLAPGPPVSSGAQPAAPLTGSAAGQPTPSPATAAPPTGPTNTSGNTSADATAESPGGLLPGQFSSQPDREPSRASSEESDEWAWRNPQMILDGKLHYAH
ncbi:MAG: hypothetical protein Q9162_005991 [Coniocarpon cinnabarinum]